MSNFCPLGFECVINESNFFGGDRCMNIETCHAWVKSWELPYYQDDDDDCCQNSKRLIVSFFETYRSLREDFSDWRKYFAEYGFAEAVSLPYFFSKRDGSMMVYIKEDNVCREEIKNAGYADAIPLPLQKRREYSFSNAEVGLIAEEKFEYQQVDLFYCGDEAINAFNAGYADAIPLLFTSLDEQRRESGDMTDY